MYACLFLSLFGDVMFVDVWRRLFVRLSVCFMSHSRRALQTAVSGAQLVIKMAAASAVTDSQMTRTPTDTQTARISPTTASAAVLVAGDDFYSDEHSTVSSTSVNELSPEYVTVPVCFFCFFCFIIYLSGCICRVFVDRSCTHTPALPLIYFELCCA